MASDNEASCVSDPNFAVICSFLEKFGSACGIQSPDFLELQEMLENTQEVSPELIDLHIKLLRKARRSVSGDRWERALIKLCHGYCSQDAWELERFGYKKARLSSKLQILKKLLEMQFDANPKFKTEINRLTAAELRTEPIGRDKYGHAYWYQVDEHCQVRVYREDPDEETWILVAKDREGLMRLISQLSSNDPSIGDLVLNEDSNSLSIEKPITDTGQTSSATSNCEVDELSAGNEIDESSAGNEVDESSAGNEIDESSAGNEIDESSTEVDASKENVTDVAEQKLTEDKPLVLITDEKPEVAKNELCNNEMKVALDMARKTEIFSEVKEENVNQHVKDENSSEVMGIDLSMSQSSSIMSSIKSVDLSNKRKKSINELAVNLRIKTHEQLCKPAVQEQEIDLSMKKNRIDVQPISSLSVPPYESSFMETALRIPLEYHDSDEELDDEEDELYESDEIELPSHIKRPRLDRPTLLGNVRKQPDSELDDEYGDEIEEEVMYVRGEGSGRDCNNENILCATLNNSSTDVEVSEAIEESVMFVYGEGSGYECDAGNNSTDEETTQDNKTGDYKSLSAGTTDASVSKDKCDANLKCDNVDKTDAECSSSKSEAETVSVSSKSSVNPEDSCTVMDCSKTDVNSVDSAIKSDNNSDNTNLPEVKSNLADINKSEDLVSRQNDDHAVKLPKVGKIIVDVKSVDKPQDINHSPVKKSRWDVGKPCIDMTTASSSVEPTKTLEHKEGNLNILDVSASTNCSINDKLVGGISKKEIVNAPNAPDAVNILENPQEEINSLPKGKVQEMVSKWEHAFDENKSNTKKSLITNIEDLVHDSDKSVQLKNTQPTVAPQKFFFGPGCFQFNTLISKSPEKKNIENTSTCTISEDIQHECDVNENKNEETCSLNVSSDDTLKHKADSTNINVHHQHVTANQSVDSSSSTSLNDTKRSISETIQNTPVMSQNETIPDEEENCTIIKDSRQENVAQNIIDAEQCLELKSTLTESSVDSGSTNITCSDINEIKNVPESSAVSSSCEVDGDSSPTSIENSTKDISQVSIKEIRTEDDVKSEEVITSEATEVTTESETSKSDNKEIPVEPILLAESENSDDVTAESSAVQDTNKEEVKSNEVDSTASNDLKTNDISDTVESSSVGQEDNETQVAEESDIVQSKTENIQINASCTVANNSSEKTADTENQIVSETDEMFTANVQEKKSEETNNGSDDKEQTVTETVNVLTENVRLDISEEKESYMEEVDEKQSSLLDTDSEQSNKSDELNFAGEITGSEKRTEPDVSNIAQTTNESGSCSINDNSDTSQESTENKHLNECTEMDAEIHTVSDISDDTSSLQVEISSLDKDQGSSNESMDVTNSSLQEDDSELQISTENSETSISENTQLQIFDATKTNSVTEIIDNSETSLVENLQVHTEVNERCEKENTDVKEHTDISQELTEADQSRSAGLVVESCSLKTDINIEAAKTIPTASELSSSTQESINNNQSDTSHTTSVLIEDSIESEKHDVTSSLEQENNDNKIATCVATEAINSDNTCPIQDGIETDKKTILNTAESSTPVLHENVPVETNNFNKKETSPVLQGTIESSNIKSLSVEEKEMFSNVDTSANKSGTCIQIISKESNVPNVELPNTAVKIDETLIETTGQTIAEHTETVSTSLNKNELTDTTVKKVNDENIQILEFVETATDLSISKGDTLKSKKDVKISTSNVVCFSENIKATLQKSTEVPFSDNIQICTHPINSNLHNTHLNEANVDLRTNLNKGNEIEKESNVLENIANLEIKKNEELSVCNTDINAEHRQSETGKRKEFDNITQGLENFNENYPLENESAVAVTKDMCKVSNVNTTLQLDSNLKLDVIKTSCEETNVLKQQTDHIETEKTESLDTSKELITETNQNIDVGKDPLEICKEKEIPDIHFDESEKEDFSSDEDRFDSCIMDPNDDGEIDGEGEELNLEEKISLPKVKEQCEETTGDDEKHVKCDTVIERKVSVLDQKNVIVSEVNISKEDFKTVLDTQKISVEKDICKLEDVSTENKSSIDKIHMANLKTDSDKPTIDDNGKPTLMCVDISKLQDASDILKPVNKSVTELKMPSDISPPRSVESVGVDNEESSDIVDVPETDPLACTEEDMLNEKTEEVSPPAPSTGLSLATFKLDGTETDNSLIPEPIARALRNRKISMEAAAAKETRKRGRPSVEEEEADVQNSVDSKRRRMRGKRPVDVNLRRSVESKHADISSSDEDPLEKSAVEDDSPTLETAQKNTTPRRGTGKARRGKRGRGRGAFANRTASSTPAQDSDLQTENTSTSPVTKTPTSSRKKRRMLGLDIDPNILVEQNKQAEDSETTGRGTVVRQSRRIAQLKIKEEAERRKIEELTLTEIKEGYKKKKSKRDDDKDYKEDKKKRKQKQATDDEEESEDEIVEISGKKSRKKKRKHQDPRKLFNSTNPWQSSSGSSTSNDEEEDEEVEEEPSDEEAVLKSDHEFSPESDLESNTEVQPLRRARTVKKESDTEEPTDEHACQKCGKADHPEWILLCDKCDCGWHCSCLRPALLVIPEGDWFCPPCQHITLVEALKVQLLEYDKKVSRRDMEVRRQERLAYVGISLNNVLPAKEQDGNRNAEENEQDEGSVEESSNSESSSGSSSGDESEPIYQLRERRQAHSYRFNDYDELINSAIQDEIEAVKGAGNQGRGKDIATIVNAEKEEAKSQALLEQQQEEQQQQVQAPALETCPPVVPVYAEKQVSEHDEVSDKDSEEELRVVPKMAGRKKHRKLNSLDISSEDDPDDDEDFKGTSEEEEEDLEDLGTEDSDDYDVGQRGKRRSGPIRRSTRARTTRYDREFINDDSDDEEPRRKKTRSIWDESESEESDTSWGKRKKSKKQRQSTSPRVIKKSRKKKKRQEDSDPDVKSRAKPKKPKIKFGGLDESDDDDEMLTRRTRGKKINYIDALGSDSDEDKSAVKRLESEEEYVANEEEDEDQEDVADAIEGKESDSDSALERPPPIVPKKLLNFKPARGGRGRGKGGIARKQKPAMIPMPASLSVPPVADEDVEDDDSPSTDIPVIAANPDDLNEEEVGTMMMENEEYAKKQLELMAIQLAKEKKKKEREAKQRAQSETIEPAPLAEPKKRGRKKKVVDPVLPIPPVGQDQTPHIMNPSLTMSPFGQNQIPPKTLLPPMNQGMSPLLMQAPSPSKLDGIPPMEISSTVPTVVSELTPSPPKRRGRGKGKKTLAAEAAAAAAAGAPLPLTPTSTSTGSIVPVLVPPSASPVTTTTAPSLIGVPGSDGVSPVITAMSTNEPPTNLSIDANIHGGKLGIASPPQPFSQSQPAPSVITRMLQSQPVSSQPFTTVASSMNQKYFGGMCDQPPPRGPPPGQFSAIGGRGRVPSPYRQSPPAGMNLYPGMRPVAPNSPHRLRSPGPPGMQQMFHSTHHPLDPSPSGGGPINIAAANRDRNSPAIVQPPTVSSPLTSKDGPTPPPQYIRGPMGPGQRFTPADASPGPSLPPPVRHHMSFAQTGAHMQQPSPPTRPPHAGNFSPYHPPPPPNYHYGAYPPAPTLAAADDALPPSDYQASPYSEPHYSTGEPIVHSSDGSNSKPFDEEGSGEFGGLVSYFSSQREDDLDT